MVLRFIGIVFAFWGVWLMRKRAPDTSSDATSDASPDNPEQSTPADRFSASLNTMNPRVLLIIGAVLTIIGVFTGW